MSDAIDQAVQATAEIQTVKLLSIQVNLAPDGRPAVVSVPIDLTDEEGHELIAWVATKLGPYLQTARRGPASRIIVPAGKIS